MGSVPQCKHLPALSGRPGSVQGNHKYAYIQRTLLSRVLTIYSLPTDSNSLAFLALCQTQSSKPKCVQNLNLFGAIYLAILRHPQSSSENLTPSYVLFLSSWLQCLCVSSTPPIPQPSCSICTSESDPHFFHRQDRQPSCWPSAMGE